MLLFIVLNSLKYVLCVPSYLVVYRFNGKNETKNELNELMDFKRAEVCLLNLTFQRTQANQQKFSLKV